MPDKCIYKRKFSVEKVNNKPIGYQFGVHFCLETPDKSSGYRWSWYLTLHLIWWNINIGLMYDYDNPILGD